MNPPVWQSLSELHLRPQFGGGPGGASPTISNLQLQEVCSVSSVLQAASVDAGKK